MNFFFPLFISIVLSFNQSKFQLKHLKALAAAANEIEIKFPMENFVFVQTVLYGQSFLSNRLNYIYFFIKLERTSEYGI